MDIFFIVVLTLIASFVGTISGFGLSTIMIPVTLIFFPLPQTLLLVGIIHWFEDLWKVLLFKNSLDKKILIWFGTFAVVASLIGARFVLTTEQAALTRTLGGFLVTYALFILFRPSFKLTENTLNTSIGGVISGFLAGIFGIGGPVRSAFLLAFNLPKGVYIFTTGVIGMATDVGRLLTYYIGGIRLDSYLWFGLLFFIPASLLGAEIAKKFSDKIPQEKLRNVIAVLLLLLGSKLLIYP